MALHAGQQPEFLAQKPDFGRFPVTAGADSGTGGGCVTARSSGERGTPRDALRLALGQRRPREGDGYLDALPTALSPQNTARSVALSSEAWSVTSRTPTSSRGESLSARGCLDSLRYYRHDSSGSLQHLRRPSNDHQTQFQPSLQPQAMPQHAQAQNLNSQLAASSCQRAVERNLEVMRFVIMREQSKMKELAEQVDEELQELFGTAAKTARFPGDEWTIDELDLRIDGVSLELMQDGENGFSTTSRICLDRYPSVEWDLNFKLCQNIVLGRSFCTFSVHAACGPDASLDVLATMVVLSRPAGQSLGFSELAPEACARLRGSGQALCMRVWPFAKSKVDLACHLELRPVQDWRKAKPPPVKWLPDGESVGEQEQQHHLFQKQKQ